MAQNSRFSPLRIDIEATAICAGDVLLTMDRPTTSASRTHTARKKAYRDFPKYYRPTWKAKVQTPDVSNLLVRDSTKPVAAPPRVKTRTALVKADDKD
ncbi:hypothetical protein ElyMa_006021200 [Elysia marginata]|uniref:Uncharacterized protein n=1 Tax=Elysia marginata TaxID=1093978 RepID=A0AAV4GJE6_9GAST|nr:hypothetical protein ElyMa_006021200 [Elysia marginata]